MPERRERDHLAAWENEGGALEAFPQSASWTRTSAPGTVMLLPGWLTRLRDALHRRLRNVRPAGSTVHLALRAGHPILCGDCGLSEQHWSGACLRCGGGAWIACGAALPARIQMARIAYGPRVGAVDRGGPSLGR